MGNNIPIVITKTYDIIIWALPQLIKFPRSFRFTLGEKIEYLFYNILEHLIDAQYSKEKIPILLKVNLQLEKLRYYIRICKDMRFISINQYEYLSREINEVGKLVGGWIRQQKGAG